MSDAADGGYRPYPAYKNSGVEWLGEVPEHWEVKRLKTIAAINPEALGENTSPDLSLEYIDISNVDSVEGVLEKQQYVFETAPSRARRIVRHGDVIVSTVRTYLRAIAEIENPEPNLVVSTGFAVIRPHTSLYSRFAGYSLRAPYFVERVVAESVGVSYPAINASEIACIGIAFPPLPEQHAIAAFLDHKTAEIDTLIAAKERLIALLREKRAALITSAVTKGLDPDVPMKDSGVEWLGEVPDHWEVKRLKAIACIIDGDRGTEYPNTEDFVNEGIPFISSKNIKENELVLDDVNFISPEKFKALRQGKLSRDDLIITVRGTIGNVAIFDSLEFQTAFINAQMMIIRPNSKVGSRFLFHVMRGHYWNEQVVTASYGTAQQQLSNKILSNLFILVPALDDQVYISLFVDKFAKELERLINKVQLGVYRLREYRTALISAAVTGKIDVRDL